MVTGTKKSGAVCGDCRRFTVVVFRKDLTAPTFSAGRKTARRTFIQPITSSFWGLAEPHPEDGYGLLHGRFRLDLSSRVRSDVAFNLVAKPAPTEGAAVGPRPTVHFSVDFYGDGPTACFFPKNKDRRTRISGSTESAKRVCTQ